MIETILMLIFGPLITGGFAFLFSFIVFKKYEKMEKEYKDTPTPTVEDMKKADLKWNIKQTLYIWVIGFFLYYGLIYYAFD